MGRAWVKEAVDTSCGADEKIVIAILQRPKSSRDNTGGNPSQYQSHELGSQGNEVTPVFTLDVHV